MQLNWLGAYSVHVTCSPACKVDKSLAVVMTFRMCLRELCFRLLIFYNLDLKIVSLIYFMVPEKMLKQNIIRQYAVLL